jgi:hypothetical protein
MLTRPERLALLEKENSLSTRQRQREERTGKAIARAEELRPCKAWQVWDKSIRFHCDNRECLAVLFAAWLPAACPRCGSVMRVRVHALEMLEMREF